VNRRVTFIKCPGNYSPDPMKYDSGKFEGGYRLAHIHRIKRYLFIVETVIVLVFAAYLLLANNGFNLVPFFLSVNSFLYFVLIMLLIIVLEGFVFTILEMRFIKSTSTKFLVTQRAVRSSLVWMVAALLIIVLLWAPILPVLVEDNLQGGDSLVASSSTDPAVMTFNNKDPLGLTEVTSIDFKVSGDAEVFIVPEDSYDRFEHDGKAVIGAYRINHVYQIGSETAVEFPPTDFGVFYILIYSSNDAPINVDYSITSEISDSIMNYLPLMALIFLAAHVIWGGYMFTEKKRNVQGIYR
jgi:hypothetical protein